MSLAMNFISRAQEELKQLQSLKSHGIEVSVPSNRVQIQQAVVPGPDESPEEKWTQLQSLKRYGIEVSVPSDSLQIWEAIAPGPDESPEDPPSSSDITIHHDDPHPVNFRVTPTLQTQNGKVRCKKSRTVFTDLQLRVLEKTFSEQKYLDSTNRDKLAHILGLNQAQVKTWFQNRRMKWKRNAVAKADKPDSSSTVLVTDLQLRVLEKTFSEQRYLESTDRAKLAHILGLKEGQVKTWFQNRRMKAASKADKPDSFSTEESRENGQSGEKNDKETGTQGRDRLDHE